METEQDYKEIFIEKFDRFCQWLTAGAGVNILDLIGEHNNNEEKPYELMRQYTMYKLLPYRGLITNKDGRIVEGIIKAIEEKKILNEDQLDKLEFFLDDPENYDKLYLYLEFFTDVAPCF